MMFLRCNLRNNSLSIGIFLIFLFFQAVGQASAGNVEHPNMTNKDLDKELSEAEFYLLIDPDTGETLLSKNSDMRVAPSSMTKLMTAYVVFDQIRKGLVSSSQQCIVGKSAWRKPGSTMFLDHGDMVSVNKLLKGLLVVSGNDASIVLAESTAGSVDDFVYLMNLKARELGLKNSQFKNTHGLSEDGHYMTMRDLATLITRTYADFPQYSTYLGIKEFTYGNITQRNRHPLIRGGYEGIVGGKTGHTDAGGYGVVSMVERKGRRLIAVVNKAKTSKLRTKIITQIFNHGFDDYKKITLFKANQSKAKVRVWLGKEPLVPVSTKQDVSFNVPREISLDSIMVKVQYEGPVHAPIRKGDKIAKLLVDVEDYKIFEYDLFANEEVEKAGYFRRIAQILKHKARNFYHKILNK